MARMEARTNGVINAQATCSNRGRSIASTIARNISALFFRMRKILPISITKISTAQHRRNQNKKIAELGLVSRVSYLRPAADQNKVFRIFVDRILLIIPVDCFQFEIGQANEVFQFVAEEEAH